MSGFDKGWLALREPADRAARNKGLVDELAACLHGQGRSATVLDIGCGTGSTWRSLSAMFPQDTNWLLLDNDRPLLEEARRQIGTAGRVCFRQHDLNDLSGLPLEGSCIVTASALFDLCSADFCARFAARIVEQACGLYAALNYNGTIRWSVRHPIDEAVVGDFNLHQRTDKGFGAALGPDASEYLARCLEPKGYCVRFGDSFWLLGEGDAALQTAFLEGFRRPLLEIGNIPEAEIETWLSFRLSAIATQGSLCEVGHTDLLALSR